MKKTKLLALSTATLLLVGSTTAIPFINQHTKFTENVYLNKNKENSESKLKHDVPDYTIRNLPIISITNPKQTNIATIQWNTTLHDEIKILSTKVQYLENRTNAVSFESFNDKSVTLRSQENDDPSKTGITIVSLDSSQSFLLNNMRNSGQFGDKVSISITYEYQGKIETQVFNSKVGLNITGMAEFEKGYRNEDIDFEVNKVQKTFDGEEKAYGSSGRIENFFNSTLKTNSGDVVYKVVEPANDSLEDQINYEIFGEKKHKVEDYFSRKFKIEKNPNNAFGYDLVYNSVGIEKNKNVLNMVSVDAFYVVKNEKNEDLFIKFKTLGQKKINISNKEDAFKQKFVITQGTRFSNIKPGKKIENIGKFYLNKPYEKNDEINQFSSIVKSIYLASDNNGEIATSWNEEISNMFLTFKVSDQKDGYPQEQWTVYDVSLNAPEDLIAPSFVDKDGITSFRVEIKTINSDIRGVLDDTEAYYSDAKNGNINICVSFPESTPSEGNEFIFQKDEVKNKKVIYESVPKVTYIEPKNKNNYDKVGANDKRAYNIYTITDENGNPLNGWTVVDNLQTAIDEQSGKFNEVKEDANKFAAFSHASSETSMPLQMKNPWTENLEEFVTMATVPTVSAVTASLPGAWLHDNAPSLLKTKYDSLLEETSAIEKFYKEQIAIQEKAVLENGAKQAELLIDKIHAFANQDSQQLGDHILKLRQMMGRRASASSIREYIDTCVTANKEYSSKLHSVVDFYEGLENYNEKMDLFEKQIKKSYESKSTKRLFDKKLFKPTFETDGEVIQHQIVDAASREKAISMLQDTYKNELHARQQVWRSQIEGVEKDVANATERAAEKATSALKKEFTEVMAEKVAKQSAVKANLAVAEEALAVEGSAMMGELVGGAIGFVIDILVSVVMYVCESLSANYANGIEFTDPELKKIIPNYGYRSLSIIAPDTIKEDKKIKIKVDSVSDKDSGKLRIDSKRVIQNTTISETITYTKESKDLGFQGSYAGDDKTSWLEMGANEKIIKFKVPEDGDIKNNTPIVAKLYDVEGNEIVEKGWKVSINEGFGSGQKTLNLTIPKTTRNPMFVIGLGYLNNDGNFVMKSRIEDQNSVDLLTEKNTRISISPDKEKHQIKLGDKKEKFENLFDFSSKYDLKADLEYKVYSDKGEEKNWVVENNDGKISILPPYYFTGEKNIHLQVYQKNKLLLISDKTTVYRGNSEFEYNVTQHDYMNPNPVKYFKRNEWNVFASVKMDFYYGGKKVNIFDKLDENLKISIRERTENDPGAFPPEIVEGLINQCRVVLTGESTFNIEVFIPDEDYKVKFNNGFFYTSLVCELELKFGENNWIKFDTLSDVPTYYLIK